MGPLPLIIGPIIRYTQETQENDSFISRHQLDGGIRLIDADFWTEAQAAFLSEALAEDADWTEIVDHLDARLRH